MKSIFFSLWGKEKQLLKYSERIILISSKNKKFFILPNKIFSSKKKFKTCVFFLPINLYSFFNEEEWIKKFNIQSRFNHSMILNIHPHSNKKKKAI